VSNTRRLRPRDPDEVEAAFAAELRKDGCPHCGSRRLVGRFHDGLWDYGLRCEASCRTFAEPRLAHRIAAEAAERAAAVTGQKLRYEAFDGSCGQIEGAVRALAGG
jgi:ribosomal protein L37AE/L43A